MSACRFVLAALLFCVATPEVATSQNTSPDSLTIETAVDLALAHHPALAWYDGRLRSVEGLRRQQRLLQSPTFSFAREAIRSGDFDEQRLVIGETISSPVATVFARRRLSSKSRAIDLERTGHAKAIRATVRRAFVDLVHANELSDLATRSVEIADGLLNAARRREAAGEAAMLEVLRARLERAEAMAALDEASRGQSSARIALYVAVGIDPNNDPPPVAAPRQLAAPDVRADSTLVEEQLRQLAHVPALLAAEAHVEAADLGVREARSAWAPDVIAEVFPQDFGDGYNSWGFQVGLKLQLPFLSKVPGQTAEARGLADQERASALDARLRLIGRTDSLRATLRSASQTIRRLQAEALIDADELVRLTNRGYELGEVSLVAVLDARRSALQVRLRYLRARHAYHRALAEIERVVGRNLEVTAF